MSGSIPFHYQGKPDSVTPQSLLDRQRKHPKNYEDQISFSGEVLLQDTKTLIYSAETEEQSVKSRTWCLNVGVFEGRYYFEVEVLEVPSHLMIGWFGIQCTVWYDVAYSLGLNPHGFMFDCSAGILWSYSLRPQSLAPPAKVGDRYGCELDANLKTITFTHITPSGTKTVATLSAANCQLDAEDLFPLFPAVGLFGGKAKLFTNRTPGGPVLPVAHGLDQTIVSHFSSSNLPDPIKGGSDFCRVLISVLEKSYVRFLKEGAYTHLLAPCWNLLLSEPDIDASKVDEVGGFEGIVESFTKTYLLPFQINYFHHVFEEKDAEWARLVAKASQHSDQLNITDVRPISELERVIRKAVFLMNIPPNENEELSQLVSHEMGELINQMRPGVLAQVPAEEKDAILDYFFTTVLFPEFYQRYLGTPERPVSLATGSEGIRKQLLQIKTNLQTPGIKSLFYALMNFNWPANLSSLFQPTKSMTDPPKLKDFSILRRELLEKIDFYLSEEASKVTISFPAAAQTQSIEPKVSPTAPNPNPLNVAPVAAVETQKNVAPSLSTGLPQQKTPQIPVQAQTLPDKPTPVKTEGTKAVPKVQSKESDTAALALFAGVGVVLLGAGLWWFISEKENK